MKVGVKYDGYGLPIIWWGEPRVHHGSALFLFVKTHWKYLARCWIGLDGRNGEAMFSHMHDANRKAWGKNTPIETPLSNIAGFSVHTARELYGRGGRPQGNGDRDSLVLVADLNQPLRPGSPPIIPLTFTTAARSDVTAPHATMTDIFLVNIDALKPALTARQEEWKRATLQEKWKNWLKPPILSGERKFVDLWELWQDKPDGTQVVPADNEAEFGIIKDTPEDGARAIRYWHVFERQRGGVTERWRARCLVKIHGPSDPWHPELVQFTRVNLEEITIAYKPRELFKAVRLFNGSELQVPQAYFSAPDVRIDASTLILCLEFFDGELLPLTYAPASERAGVETLRRQMEYVFAGEGSGGPQIVL